MSIGASTPQKCNHAMANHLFQNFYCPKGGNCEKVGRIFFHVITLGVPLLIYHTSKLFVGLFRVDVMQPSESNDTSKIFDEVIKKAEESTLSSPSSESDSLAKTDLVAIEEAVQKRVLGKDPFPYSNRAQAAIDFAREAMKNSEITINFDAGFGPVDDDVKKLFCFYYEVQIKNFEKILNVHNTAELTHFSKGKEAIRDKVWEDPEVVKAAYQTVQVAFALSCLSLEDIPNFVEERAKVKKEAKRTYIDAIIEQDTYLKHTPYLCSLAYHWMRGKAFFFDLDPIKNRPRPGIHWINGYEPAPEDGKFYQEGTLHYEARELYHEYCELARDYIPEIMTCRDDRLQQWTEKDVKGQEFGCSGGTMPT